MTILSAERDGAGFWYGWFEDDPRQVNVREREADETEKFDNRFIAYVGSTCVGSYVTKDEAEAAAIAYLKTSRNS